MRTCVLAHFLQFIIQQQTPPKKAGYQNLYTQNNKDTEICPTPSPSCPYSLSRRRRTLLLPSILCILLHTAPLSFPKFALILILVMLRLAIAKSDLAMIRLLRWRVKCRTELWRAGSTLLLLHEILRLPGIVVAVRWRGKIERRTYLMSTSLRSRWRG